MKSLHLVFPFALALLLGCSGTVVLSSSSNGGGGSGGSGGASTTTTTTGQTTGTTGQGGAGGGIFTGGTAGAGGTTTGSMGCPVVLDKGFYVDFTIDGQMHHMTSKCGGADPMGPSALMFHSKGGSTQFEISACDTPGQPNPNIDLYVTDPTSPGTVTVVYYTDAQGQSSGDMLGVSTFNSFGPEWTDATGTFDGKLIFQDGTAHTIDGSFLVCRRPDSYAP